VINVKPN